MKALEVLSKLKANGVELYLGGDGALRARGGNFTPELRSAAGFHRVKLEEMLRLTSRSERAAQLFGAEAEWLQQAGGALGRENVVSESMEKLLHKAEMNYYDGTGTIHEVEAAFFEYVRALGTRKLNRQLVGEIYNPTFEGKRVGSAEVQAEFVKMVAGEHAGVRRVLRSSVTPQVEATEDQVAKMAIYFGITRDSYVTASARARGKN